MIFIVAAAALAMLALATQAGILVLQRMYPERAA